MWWRKSPARPIEPYLGEIIGDIAPRRATYPRRPQGSRWVETMTDVTMKLAAVVVGVAAVIVMGASVRSALGHEKQGRVWLGSQIDCRPVFGVKVVTAPSPGFRLPTGEFVHRDDAMPTPDLPAGVWPYWRCRFGSRVRFFAGPEER